MLTLLPLLDERLNHLVIEIGALGPRRQLGFEVAGRLGGRELTDLIAAEGPILAPGAHQDAAVVEAMELGAAIDDNGEHQGILDRGLMPAGLYQGAAPLYASLERHLNLVGEDLFSDLAPLVNSDQDGAAIGIGKCNQGLGQQARIRLGHERTQLPRFPLL
jgi:hypothetical protein